VGQPPKPGRGERASRVGFLAVWCFASWVLLTWTMTAEVLVVGAAISLAIAALIAPIGPVAAPWSLLRRPFRLLRLVADVAWRMLIANLVLARRIWRRRLVVPSGIIIVPTRAISDAELCGVGVLTSLIVDNQIMDVDRRRDVLLYHAIAVPPGTRGERYAAINGPIEAQLAALSGATDE
jgi:multicomponent Na+:H+ antiporter subunit E